jgi:DNA-binding MarR family transcriptional regulator
MDSIETLTERECIQINQAIFSLRNVYEARLRRESGEGEPDLGVAEIGLLMVVGQVGPVTSRRLAQMVDLTAGTVSLYVKKLRARGLLEQHRDDDDRRIWWLSVTPAGGAVCERSVAGAVRYTREIISMLSGDDQHTLHRLLLTLSHENGYEWQ